MAKKIFYCILLALIVLVVVFLGAAIKVNNPVLWLFRIIIGGALFVGGYSLGRKIK